MHRLSILAIAILILPTIIICHDVSAAAAVIEVSNCAAEPWGRYSMVGDWNADGTVFYSFSGDTSSASDGLGGVVRTNWKYDLTTNCWSRMPSAASENNVAVGYRATAVRLRDNGIVVYAGADDRFRAVDRLWRFDEETEQLEDITARYGDENSRPSARFKQAAIAILDGNTMLVTGGRQGGDVLSDIWTFSFASGWEMMTDNGFSGESLYRHGMAWDPDTGTVWAFGGLDGSFQRNAELWRADAKDLASGFSKVNRTTWLIDPPKSASLGMTYFNGRVYVWGGTCSDDSALFMYDAESNSWCKVPVKDSLIGYSKPSRRDAFMWLPRFYQGESSSGSFISSNQTESKLEIIMAGGDVICVYGGQSAYTVMDVWQLSIEDSSIDWTLLYRPYTARNPAHASNICSNWQRTNCRAAVSIEEDLAGTSRLSGENSTEGRCHIPSGTFGDNVESVDGTDGGSSATGDDRSSSEEISAAPHRQFQIRVTIATALLGAVLLDAL